MRLIVGIDVSFELIHKQTKRKNCLGVNSSNFHPSCRYSLYLIPVRL